MGDVLAELIELLVLERIEENLFRGQSQDLGWGRVFGGQVVGQALSAADQTVPDDRPVHSMHAYFLRPGDARKPIVFHVDPIRDGRSFTTRRVVAVQNGHAILNLAASFQVDEPGLEHQDTAPDVRPPEELLSQRDLALAAIDRIPEPLRAMATAERPIETRPAQSQNPLDPKVRPPVRRVWFRTRGKLPDDDALHRYLLAYTSDFSFLTTSMQPHGVDWLTPGFQVASIDHAMWFHRPFRMDEWLLHDIESPSASGARGLVRGRFFDRQGRLVASTVQEGLIRDRRR
ncbi:MAG: acyl-CoA thioesterase II [Myxococcales bacterium]|nr:acyl-CoA thioesterase II [Myxococcales bacterium]MCB8999138.1 acyl-CoA thioesterase II [Bacteroidales bacterium]MCB9668880.1 acyl-CoA thioesterase II [Alphaproteobacteria bacterium]MCB9691206.1 acyl-CoA thioesterase II [Alphaproteobacteria bacterium]